MTQQLLDMSAPSAKLVFDQGSYRPLEFDYTDNNDVPIPLPSGARMAFRDINFGTVLLLLTTGNGRLTVVGNALSGALKSTDTNLASAFAGIYVGLWDIYLDPSGVEDDFSYKWLGGRWEMIPEVTP
jgi:hypothetical protein